MVKALQRLSVPDRDIPRAKTFIGTLRPLPRLFSHAAAIVTMVLESHQSRRKGIEQSDIYKYWALGAELFSIRP